MPTISGRKERLFDYYLMISDWLSMKTWMMAPGTLYVVAPTMNIARNNMPENIEWHLPTLQISEFGIPVFPAVQVITGGQLAVFCLRLVLVLQIQVKLVPLCLPGVEDLEVRRLWERSSILRNRENWWQSSLLTQIQISNLSRVTPLVPKWHTIMVVLLPYAGGYWNVMFSQFNIMVCLKTFEYNYKSISLLVPKLTLPSMPRLELTSSPWCLLLHWHTGSVCHIKGFIPSLHLRDCKDLI